MKKISRILQKSKFAANIGNKKGCYKKEVVKVALRFTGITSMQTGVYAPTSKHYSGRTHKRNR